MPRETKSELEHELERASKRAKTVVNKVADEFLCPITGELPVDPVTAEDGKIYERAAIAEWLLKKNTSPMTNLVMGPRLFPATQVKNMIDELVRSGSIEGEKVTAWKKHHEEQRKLEDLRARALSGDESAMAAMGVAYQHGKYGLNENFRMARVWFRKGAMRHNYQCMAYYAQSLLEREQGVHTGLIFCTRAADHGEPMALLILGQLFASGRCGVGRDRSQAKFWFRKVINSPSANDRMKAYAQETLRKLSTESMLAMTFFRLGEPDYESE